MGPSGSGSSRGLACKPVMVLRGATLCDGVRLLGGPAKAGRTASRPKLFGERIGVQDWTCLYDCDHFRCGRQRVPTSKLIQSDILYV
jgi:hypothetical protein